MRLPDHESPRALARALGPLPVTSANLSGHPEAHHAADVLAQLGSRIDLVLDGGRCGGIEVTDESGRTVDLQELQEDPTPPALSEDASEE